MSYNPQTDYNAFQEHKNSPASFSKAKNYSRRWINGEVKNQFIYKDAKGNTLSKSEYQKRRHKLQKEYGNNLAVAYRTGKLKNPVFAIDESGYPPDRGLLPYLKKINKNPELVTVFSNAGFAPDGNRSPAKLGLRFKNRQACKRYTTKLLRAGIIANCFGNTGEIKEPKMENKQDALRFWRKTSMILSEKDSNIARHSRNDIERM